MLVRARTMTDFQNRLWLRNIQAFLLSVSSCGSLAVMHLRQQNGRRLGSSPGRVRGGALMTEIQSLRRSPVLRTAIVGDSAIKRQRGAILADLGQCP